MMSLLTLNMKAIANGCNMKTLVFVFFLAIAMSCSAGIEEEKLDFYEKNSSSLDFVLKKNHFEHDELADAIDVKFPRF